MEINELKLWKNFSFNLSFLATRDTAVNKNCQHFLDCSSRQASFCWFMKNQQNWRFGAEIGKYWTFSSLMDAPHLFNCSMLSSSVHTRTLWNASQTQSFYLLTSKSGNGKISLTFIHSLAPSLCSPSKLCFYLPVIKISIHKH